MNDQMLTGVSETLLWTLYQRAAEARRDDGVIRDPMAVELVERIDYPFAERFGDPWMGHWQALRARAFDRVIERYLKARPDGTVVALGEGLETQFWRVDNGRVRWISVELPEVTDLERRVLPAEERRRLVARSVLDLTWIDEVDEPRGPLVTAQGLFMYLQPAEVRELIAAMAERFPGGGLVFDAMPRWFGAKTHSGAMATPGGFRPPPMPWSMDSNERADLASIHPGIVSVRDVPLPRGRGAIGWLIPRIGRIPFAGPRRPTVTLLRFGHPRRPAE